MRTSVADTSIVNLDADFVGLWWGYFNVFDREIFASFPGDSSLCGVSRACGGPVARRSYLAGDGLALS
jgi:hypothetical protein